MHYVHILSYQHFNTLIGTNQKKISRRESKCKFTLLIITPLLMYVVPLLFKLLFAVTLWV